MASKIILPNGITMAQLGPSKNTRPERVVRMWLVRNGYRHKVHRRVFGYSVDLVVKPSPWDLVAVEVHGRFWHCPKTSGMGKMSKYWRDKLKRNVERDRRKRRILRSFGYRVVVVWDDEVKQGHWKVRLSRLLGPPSASSMEARTSRRCTRRPRP